MLERTFMHISGIGRKTETLLWRKGIHTWYHFLDHGSEIFSPSRDRYIREQLRDSINNKTNIAFFKDRLCTDEMWRLFQTFRNRCVYLDIETTGGYQGINDITVIGIYDGRDYLTFINGKNLEEFESAICDYDLVITFNGSTFDLPFIKKWYRNITLPPAHIDLRFLLKRLGYKGGLKRIEKDMGISREEDICDMNGYDAVMLWKAYEWGDKEALNVLLRYNKADVVNLERLMEFCYERMKELILGVI